MKLHVMLDIETLGQGNFSALLSIGACKFYPGTDGVVDRFQVFVDPESCQKIGMRIDGPTVMWWLAPERAAAREKLMQSGIERLSIHDALSGFAQWYGPDSRPTWGNGAGFDNVIVGNAFKLAGLDCPWKFWDDRCFRTVKSLDARRELEPTLIGDAHVAVDDAVHQARWLQAIVRARSLDL